MRREIFLHFAFWFAFFVFISIVHKYFSVIGLTFWLGGIVGTILPDIDHILYLYLKPHELTSQRINFLIDKQEIKRVFTLLYETRSERKDLIFHTAFFQLIFLVSTFWIMSSSTSLFGRGLVLAFSLHLLIDQVVDMLEIGNFSNWLKYSPWQVDMQRARSYWLVMLALLLLFGFLL